MKNITIRQLKAFECVARNLSYSRAAEDLHLTQPAVSMQVKQLEEQTGMVLFSHVGRRIGLTEAGKLLLRHSVVILADLKAAEQSLASLRSGAAERLRVGLITSGSYFFPQLVSAYMQDKQHIGLDLTVRSRDHLIALLRDDQIDLAVMVHAPEDAGIAAEPFAPNPFVLVAAPTHSLADERDIPYSRLARECLIVRESGTDTRTAANDAFSMHASGPRFMEVGCAEAVKQSVMAGFGISFLAAHAVQFELRAGLLKVLDVQSFPLKRHWCVVQRADRHLPPSALDFRQFLLREGGARLEHLMGIDKVHIGMKSHSPAIDDTARESRPVAASSTRHDVVVRTRALLRDDRLPDQHGVQAEDHACSERSDAGEPASRRKSAHH
jgi:DNA-binding transcriptional LysR family regulator